MKPHGNNGVRSGSARVTGLVLGVLALLGVAAVGYAIYTLAQPAPKPVIDEPTAEDGIASTRTLEGVLASVQTLVRDEEYSQAKTVLESAVVQYPGDLDLRVSYGDLLMVTGAYAEAYDQFVAAIEIGPATADMEFTAGTLANTLGQKEAAVGHYERALRMNPGNPEYPLYLAAVQIQLNNLTDAKTNLALAAQLAPDRAEIWAMRADVLLRENRGPVALQMVQKARELQPRVVDWIVLEAKIQKRTGNTERAINLLTGLPEEDLRDPEILKLLAECFGMMGHPGDAASRYLDAAQARPEDADLAFACAVWLERAGDREGAMRWGRRARDLGHANAAEWLQTLP
ncbi:MAG: tetratricopeptide repeat protein [Phycisphaerales bacterium]|nr:tetratricopeptide repeat protein [Phycisphaerales bacterium]